MTVVLAAGLLLALTAGTLRMACFTVYRVAGASMEDALRDGDRILVLDGPWCLKAPAPGDTVVASVEGEVLVKRIVAGPGDVVAIQGGLLVRNGLPVPEAIPAAHQRHDDMGSHRLAGDEYFLLGDHRRVSVDSRDFGPVSLEQIVGRVLLRLSGEGLSSVAALERT